MFLTLLTAVNEGEQKISLWTILIVLAMIALVVFIFRNVRR